MMSNVIRYAGSVTLAVITTLSAFFVMHLLIRNDGTYVPPEEPLALIRFEQIEILPEIDTEDPFVKPEREQIEPQPELEIPDSVVDIDPVDFEIPKVARAGMPELPPGFGQPGRRAGTGGEAVCNTRVAPLYPRDMALRGIEGSVTVAFTITTAGTVRDVEVIGSGPQRGFDQAARNAVARWKCEPRMVNGAVVEQRVTQTIDFKLDGS